MPTPALRRPDRRWLLVVVVLAIPVLVLVVSLAQRTWYPTGDQAQAELRMRSLPSDPPLLGAAGRIEDAAGRQGNHPGPLMFWATWPLYALLGRSAWAFAAATALVNLAWLAVSVWLVQRRAGPAVTAGYGIVALVLIGGFGLDALSQPWNPWVALLPFTVLILATWSALEGDRWMPVLATAAGSYALQGHIGYLPLVLPLCGLALVAPVWHRWRRAGAGAGAGADAGADGGGSLVGALRWAALPTAASVGTALLLWSGPLWDLRTGNPNNVSKLIDNFSNPSEAPIGLQRGLEAVFQASAPFGAWVWGGTAVEGSAWPGKLFLLAWAIVAVLVARRGTHRPLDRLNALLTATLLVAMVAVSRIFGSLYLYTFRWILVIVALQVLTLGWGLAVLLPRPSPRVATRLVGVAVAVLVLLSGVTAVRLARQEIPYDQSSRAERVLAPATAAALDPSTRYLVRWDDPAYLGGLGFGLILDLERRGFDVGADPRTRAAVEPQRVRCPGDYDAVLLVVTGVRNIEAYRQDPAWREIADADPREDPARWEEAYDELLAQLAAEGTPKTPEELERQLNGLLLNDGQSEEVHDLAAEIVLGGVPSAVFLQDPAAPAPPVEQIPVNQPCW